MSSSTSSFKDNHNESSSSNNVRIPNSKNNKNNELIADDDDFVTGNFSAKYHTKQHPASSVIHDSASSVITGGTSISNQQHPPVTIDGFDTPSSSLKVLNSRTSNQRRQSILSNLMSSNISGSPTSPMMNKDNGSNNMVNNPSQDVVSVVNKHLVQDNESDLIPIRSTETSSRFDSLQLQGGDVTRDLYNWVDRHESQKRSNSFSEFSSRINEGDGDNDAASNFIEEVSVNDLMVPGGFRRDFMKKQKNVEKETKNFIEFIYLYGHFAGEEMDDDEDDDDDDIEEDENLPLLNNSRYNSFNSTLDNNLIRQNLKMRRKFAQKPKPKTTSNFKSFLLLLKAFLGTGVLFLPKSFSNGGLLYSNLMIVFFSILSYYCFVTLIKIRSRLNVSSYGNLGLVLYGTPFKMIILASIILSQIGFSSAYIVFVATNFQELIPKEISLQILILVQLLFFIPMSLIRKISKLSLVVLISDFFILLGLLYVYYYSIYNMAINKINWSNITLLIDSQKWSLFIGTAIFTYEGIGLLIPIQEAMTNPQSFNKILLIVMIIITVIFITIGSISYISFGNDVKTVILLNFANSELIQLIYSVAILLSTPLQLFPGIKMIELVWFNQGTENRKFDPRNIDKSIDLIKSGKKDPVIKFKKNIVRVGVVVLTVLISIIGSNDLDKFVSLIGSFTCVPLIYVFPPLLSLKIVKIDQIKIGDYNIKINHENDSKLIKIIDYCVLVLGITMMTYTSTATLYDWIK